MLLGWALLLHAIGQTFVQRRLGRCVLLNLLKARPSASATSPASELGPLPQSFVRRQVHLRCANDSWASSSSLAVVAEYDVDLVVLGVSHRDSTLIEGVTLLLTGLNSSSGDSRRTLHLVSHRKIRSLLGAF
mmetsp:Transcript_38858/g.59062  ORF Transcript_38858/g.59062 Transcript_38858/m.59062 type:complete len:132 (-) Transcript_38858:166-561(-)